MNTSNPFRGDETGAGESLASRNIWLIALGLTFVAFAIRVVGLPDRAMHPDEWYHILTGHALAEGHGFTYVRGIYPRDKLYTWLAAMVMEITGWAPLISSRVPALLFGSAGVGLFYLLGRKSTCAIVALVAAALLMFDALAVEWSQYARFYSLQMVCVMLLALLFADFPRGARDPWRWVLGAAIALVALHVQITSASSLAGLALFMALQTRLGTPTFWETHWRARPTLVIAGLVAFVIAAGLALALAWPELRKADFWALRDADNLLFYDDSLRWMYATWWPLTPFAALLGWVRWRRATLLCVWVTLPVLAVQSLGAMKSPRYIVHVLPFLILIWAIGLVEAARWAASFVEGWLRREVVRDERGAIPVSRWIATVIALFAAGFVIAGNRSPRGPIKDAMIQARAFAARPARLADNPGPLFWPREAARVRGLLRSGAILVTTDPASTAYYIAMPDVRLQDVTTDDGRLFTYVRKFGLLSITKPREIEALVRCVPKGDIIVQGDYIFWGKVRPEMIATLNRLAKRVDLHTSELLMWQWTSTPVPDEPACGRIRRIFAAYHRS